MISRESLVTAVTAVALLVAVVALVATRSWRTAVRLLLDLLTAAGLLRLSSGQSWTALATAAGIVVLRQALSAALIGTGGADPGARRRVDRRPRVRSEA